MAAIRYYLAPDVSLYGRAASGYKPSSSNAGGPGFQQIVHAETLVNYEAGLKSEFLDRKARVDFSVFYVDWRDVQVAEYNSYYDTIDGGYAAAKGAELATAYSPRPGLELICSAAFTQSAFTRTASPSYFLADYQLWNVPKWSVALAANYEVPVTPMWRVRVGGVFRWVERVWALPVASLVLGGGPTFELPSYSVLDLNAGITNGRLALKMFARNLANKRAYLGAYNYFNGADGTFGPTDYFLLQPRTVGIGFDYAF
jgi:outer membrane receptor protein involved in Fe transport